MESFRDYPNDVLNTVHNAYICADLSTSVFPAKPKNKIKCMQYRYVQQINPTMRRFVVQIMKQHWAKPMSITSLLYISNE